MSHQNSGPRIYVHRQMFDQMVEQKDARIRQLEGRLALCADCANLRISAAARIRELEAALRDFQDFSTPKTRAKV